MVKWKAGQKSLVANVQTSTTQYYEGTSAATESTAPFFICCTEPVEFK